MDLCLRKSFGSTGLTELLDAAGVPKGSFYHHFGSKEGFGAALIARYSKAALGDLRAWLDAPDRDPRLSLLGYYASREDAMRTRGGASRCLSTKLSAEVCGLSEDMRHALDAHLAAQVAAISGAIARATSFGFAPAAPAEELAGNIHALWTGALLVSMTRHDLTPLGHARRGIAAMLGLPDTADIPNIPTQNKGQTP